MASRDFSFGWKVYRASGIYYSGTGHMRPAHAAEAAADELLEYLRRETGGLFSIKALVETSPSHNYLVKTASGEEIRISWSWRREEIENTDIEPRDDIWDEEFKESLTQSFDSTLIH